MGRLWECQFYGSVNFQINVIVFVMITHQQMHFISILLKSIDNWIRIPSLHKI